MTQSADHLRKISNGLFLLIIATFGIWVATLRGHLSLGISEVVVDISFAPVADNEHVPKWDIWLFQNTGPFVSQRNWFFSRFFVASVRISTRCHCLQKNDILHPNSHTVAAVPLFAILVTLVTILCAIWVWHLRTKKRPGYCQECGYNLQMLVGTQCPECGTPITHQLDTAHPRSNDPAT